MTEHTHTDTVKAILRRSPPGLLLFFYRECEPVSVPYMYIGIMQRPEHPIFAKNALAMITPTTLLVVNAFTTNTSWTQAVRFESLML